MLLTILILLSLLIFSTIGLDLFLYFKDVFMRIKIGRWEDTGAWHEQIAEVNKKWLEHMPTVKITDNNRYVILDILNKRYKSTTIQSWQEAGVLLGLASPLSAYDIKPYLEKKVNLNTRTWKLPIQQVDEALLAYAIGKHLENHNEFKPLFDDTLAFILNLKGEEGTVMYRSFIPDIRFVDTLGFICPFLIFYGTTFDRRDCIHLALDQFKKYSQEAMLHNWHLPAHAYNVKIKIPLGSFGWGRGMGWYILALIGMYLEIPENMLHEKDELKTLIIKTADQLMTFQHKDGGYSWMLQVPSSRYDSSITTLAGWLFLHAWLITGNAKYYHTLKGCICALKKSTRRNGAIDHCQGDTKGIGVYAQDFDVMPFVQGITVALMDKAKENHLLF